MQLLYLLPKFKTIKPKIISFEPKKLIGLRDQMSLSEDKTKELWQSFMPNRKDILHSIPDVFYSVNIFDPDLKMKDFTPNTSFEKWAAIEVTELDAAPDGMEVLMLGKGDYAVFIHKGPASTFHKTLGYIFAEWIPNSNYSLDNARPHFELLGIDFKPNDPNSQEEVWIPIK